MLGDESGELEICRCKGCDGRAVVGLGRVTDDGPVDVVAAQLLRLEKDFPRGLEERAAKIAKEALTTGKTIREVARERTKLAADELDRLLDPSRMTKPGVDAGPAGG